MTIPPSLAQPSFSQAPIETTDPNAISKTVVDAKGDLIAGTADNAVTRQPVGTDGEFLVADSSQATGLDWVANPVNTAFDAKGDLLVGTGADTYAKLPVGTNNQVLVADSSQASGVRWSSEQDPNAIVKSIVDAKGDLIAATADDTPARLPVGTNDQLLIADSAQSTGLKWGRPTIALGTETSGDYVAGVTGGTGVTVTGSGGEGSTPSVAIGQAVGTGDTVAFGGLNVDSGTLYVDSTNNRVGINDTTPSYGLDVTGDGHFTTDLTVDGILYANHIHGNLAGSLYYHIKNNSGSTINIGTPVYITGTVGSTQVAEVSPSRADTPATMPAVGITGSTLAQGDTGHMVVIGNLDGINTNAYTLSAPLYVGATGGLTNTRPTGASDVIQVIAYAARINSSTGELIVNAYDQVRTPNSISVSGNIATTAGQFTGSGAGLTSIPAGQLTGTVGASNIGNDTVALGTKTTGDYVATLQAGTGVTVTNGSGEGVSPTVAIGQAVGTTDSPQFAGLTTTGTANLNAASVTGSVSANSLSATTSITGASLVVDGIEIDTTGATSNQILTYNGTKFAPAAPAAAAAGTLTGTTLASNVVSSSLTSVGALNGLTVINGLTATGGSTLTGGTVIATATAGQDSVTITGRAGGTSSYSATLTPTTLTANRTLTLPNETGTVVSTATVDPSGATTNQVLKYNGTKFVPSTGASVTVSDTPPTSPTPQSGDQWYESDTGRTFIFYDNVWVEIGSTATTNVNANDLSGTTLASNVVSSSLTSVGTITNLQATAATINGWTVSQPGLVFIKSQSISSGASSVNVTSAFSSSYDAYKIVITGGALSATANISLKLGSTTSSYYSSRILNYPNNGTPAGNGENNTSAWGYAAQGGTNHVNCNIELLNPYLSKYTTYSGSYFIDSGAGSEIGTTQGFLANTTSYTDFTLTPAGQTFSSGTVRVYGYRNS